MHINRELFYNLKDEFMVEFLRDDIDTIKLMLHFGIGNENEFKNNKKLLKAYKTILEYYGVDHD